MSDKPSESVKCILIGESGVGKTGLVVSYTKDGYPGQHEPTAFDTYVVDLRVENRQINLQICDAGGDPGVRSLRELAYPDVQVVILCFSVVQPRSLWALRDHWLPELASSGLRLNPAARETAVRIGCLPPSPPSPPAATTSPGPAFILVGCACDLRNDIKSLLVLSERNEKPVNEAVAHQIAVEFGAEAYIECSALTQKQLKKVFDLAVWYGLQAKCPSLQQHPGSDGKPSVRNSLALGSGRNSVERRSKRRREGSSDSVHLNRVPRSIWKKLFCLR